MAGNTRNRDPKKKVYTEKHKDKDELKFTDKVIEFFSDVFTPVAFLRDPVKIMDDIYKQLGKQVANHQVFFQNLSYLAAPVVAIASLIKLVKYTDDLKGKRAEEAKNNTQVKTVSKVNRAMKVISNVAGVVIAYAGIVLLATPAAWPFIVIASAVKSMYDSWREIGVALFKRRGVKKEIQQLELKIKAEIQFPNLNDDPTEAEARKYKKLTLLTNTINRKKDLDKKIANGSHSFAQSCIALTAGVLCIAAPPIGVIMLSAIAIYTVLDALNLNPFKWIARGINALSKKIRGKEIPILDPFRHKTEEEVAHRIHKKYGSEPQQKPSVTENNKKIVFRSSETNILKRLKNLVFGKKEIKNQAKDKRAQNLATRVSHNTGFSFVNETHSEESKLQPVTRDSNDPRPQN